MCLTGVRSISCLFEFLNDNWFNINVDLCTKVSTQTEPSPSSLQPEYEASPCWGWSLEPDTQEFHTTSRSCPLLFWQSQSLWPEIKKQHNCYKKNKYIKVTMQDYNSAGWLNYHRFDRHKCYCHRQKRTKSKPTELHTGPVRTVVFWNCLTRLQRRVYHSN